MCLPFALCDRLSIRLLARPSVCLHVGWIVGMRFYGHCIELVMMVVDSFSGGCVEEVFVLFVIEYFYFL